MSRLSARATDRMVQALRASALFAQLDEGPLRTLAGCCTARDVPAGRLLFSRGDPADGVYVITSGLMRVWLNDVEGNEMTLALLGPGEALGEMALADPAPRSANATALETSRCLFLDAQDFTRAMEREPPIARHLVSLLSARLRGGNAALMDITFVPLRARLCRKLLELAEVHARPVPPGVVFDRVFSQSELAQMLGASREAVNRQLGALRHDGHLRFDGRRMELPDLARLRATLGAE